MEYIIVGVVVAAALACPVLMCGPMLLRRFGIKGGSADMSCMGMMPGGRKPSDPQVRDLLARRNAIDAEIARVQSSAGEGAGNQASPRTSTPHPTNAA
jgi:hypothetical protein